MADHATNLDTLDAAELSQILPLSEATIRADVYRRPWLLPPFVRVGSKVVWLKQTVLDWLKSREVVVLPPSPARSSRGRRGRPTKAEQIARARQQVAA